ncbi:helix-turn-helix domain-containing protein [Rhodoligotrophos defluvii]|uniref:helix-turn-helix domain-containing protein n=1 Tax=Rhodoligotrophos defluvii TaxID=2561934 RepID=UPI0010C94DB2|nr:AraC family transcriptional regulator [Rhodoligotrophos defluvii]
MGNIRYDYTGDGRLLEGADWIGLRPHGLEPHYHAEVQASIVWRGEREYRIGDRRLRLRPGQVLVVPPWRAHHALPSMRGDIRSTEFYIAGSTLSAETAGWLNQFGYVVLERPDLVDLSPVEAAGLLTEHLAAAPDAVIFDAAPAQLPNGTGRLSQAVARHDQIADAAQALGFSREGFIRAFARSFGLTPHAYKVNLRLNEARQLLRQGEAIADVAYATGFSDQSHFGRMFLRFFGATPGQFRAAHAAAC